MSCLAPSPCAYSTPIYRAVTPRKRGRKPKGDVADAEAKG